MSMPEGTMDKDVFDALPAEEQAKILSDTETAYELAAEEVEEAEQNLSAEKYAEAFPVIPS